MLFLHRIPDDFIIGKSASLQTCNDSVGAHGTMGDQIIPDFCIINGPASPSSCRRRALPRFSLLEIDVEKIPLGHLPIFGTFQRGS